MVRRCGWGDWKRGVERRGRVGAAVGGPRGPRQSGGTGPEETEVGGLERRFEKCELRIRYRRIERRLDSGRIRLELAKRGGHIRSAICFGRRQKGAVLSLAGGRTDEVGG